jgi:hypothetical protein
MRPQGLHLPVEHCNYGASFLAGIRASSVERCAAACWRFNSRMASLPRYQQVLRYRRRITSSGNARITNE